MDQKMIASRIVTTIMAHQHEAMNHLDDIKKSITDEQYLSIANALMSASKAKDENFTAPAPAPEMAPLVHRPEPSPKKSYHTLRSDKYYSRFHWSNKPIKFETGNKQYALFLKNKDYHILEADKDKTQMESYIYNDTFMGRVCEEGSKTWSDWSPLYFSTNSNKIKQLLESKSQEEFDSIRTKFCVKLI